MLHFMGLPHFVYPFIVGGPFGYCEDCCYEHGCVNICLLPLRLCSDAFTPGEGTVRGSDVWLHPHSRCRPQAVIGIFDCGA